MNRALLPLTVACLLVAAFAAAELSQTYKDWAGGPAGFLLTKKERKEFEKLTTDKDAQAFIDLFWAKRDPDLNTPVNEFKMEFEARVTAADRSFGFGKIAGSMSDRGRTLVLLGRPHARESFPAGSPVQPMRSTEPTSGMGETTLPQGEQERGNSEIWEYVTDQLPQGTKAAEVFFYFAESRLGANDFQLARMDTRNSMAMKLLASVAEARLVSPDLKEVPRLGLLAGSKAAAAQDLAIFSAEPRPWPEGAQTFGTTGVMSPSIHPLWLFVEMPSASPAATRVVGRARPAGGGEDAGTFVAPVKATDVAAGRAYEFMIPVASGKWAVDLALFGEMAPIAVTTVEVENEVVPDEKTYFSPFYWGADIRQDTQAKLGDPFNVGGWHIIPNLTGKYTPKDSVSYFCYVLRPGLVPPAAPPTEGQPAAEPQPKLELKVKVSLDGKALGELPPQAVQLSHVYGDLWMFGNALPLQGFRKAGNYELELTLHDTVTDAARTVKIPIGMVIEQSAAAPQP